MATLPMCIASLAAAPPSPPYRPVDASVVIPSIDGVDGTASASSDLCGGTRLCPPSKAFDGTQP